jgi:glutamine synthetase
MTPEGESAIGGIICGLPQAQLIFCGSIVSGLRMQPGNWAGAFSCWGTENREAAVRFVRGTHGNPYGAHVEVKVVDPSANPYFATAAILGLALDGIDSGSALPPETLVDPGTLSDDDRKAAGTVALSSDQAEEIAALDGSERLRTILGDPAVDVIVAVRRYEHETYSHLDADALTDKFRMAWSL